jgi:hypothetical protein
MPREGENEFVTFEKKYLAEAQSRNERLYGSGKTVD